MVHVIFDLDGTLVHTPLEYAHDICLEAFKRYGWTPTMHDAKRLWYGGDRNDQLRQRGIDYEEFWPHFQSIDTIDRRLKHAVPYADVDALRSLRRQGHTLSIVTNAPAYLAYGESALLGVPFEIIVPALPGVPHKPHPDLLQYCMAQLGARADNSVYIGNGHEDVAAAKAANVLDVFIDRGEYETDHIEATRRISSLRELVPIENVLHTFAR